jgi:hypothetical protein
MVEFAKQFVGKIEKNDVAGPGYSGESLPARRD